MHDYITYPTDLLGPLTLIANATGLTAVLMENSRFADAQTPKDAQPDADNPHLVRAIEWLDRYFAGERPESNELADIFAPEGSDFRRRVWSILAEIPYGETTTYGAIAARIARETGREKMSAQAVGGAVGHNPIGLIIPCHRVIGANKSLTGYGGGMQRKIALLEFEGVDMSDLTVPTKGTAL